MKKLYCLYISLLLLALTACHDKPKPLHPALARAERLLSSHPDSALHVLARYHLRSFSDSADMAAYALLRTQAEDKNYITHTSDSLIRIAVGYYSRHGDDRHKALAHYYLGRVYQDKGDDVNTTVQFLAANPLAEAAKDTDLICKVKSNLGYLLWDNNILLNQADSLYRLTARIEKERNNKINLALCYEKIADISILKGHEYYKVAKKYLDEALFISKQLSDTIIRRDVLTSLASLDLLQGKYQECITIAKEGIKITPIEICDGYYYNIGASLLKLNQLDSAFYYLDKCLNMNENMSKTSIYEELRDLSTKRGEPKAALFYASKVDSCLKANLIRRTPEKVITAIKDAVIHQQKVESKQSFINILLLFIFISIIALIIFLYKHKQRNKIFESLNATVRQKDDVIKYTKMKRDVAIEVVKSLKEKESLSSSHICDRIKENHSYLALMKVMNHNKDIVEKEDKIHLSDDDWAALITSVENLLPDYINRLNQMHESLLKSDIRFCILIRLGFNLTEIENIYGHSHQAINKRKNALLDKLELSTFEELSKMLEDM